MAIKAIQSKLPPDSTIYQAKEFLRDNAVKGAECPCCRQRVQIYARALTSGMAAGLIIFYHNRGKGWLHAEKTFKESSCNQSIRGDFPKLRFWGLIEAKEENREDDSDRNGYYRITEKGIQFVLGHLSVPRSVFIYNNAFRGFDSLETDVKKALGVKFHYAKLMEG